MNRFFILCIILSLIASISSSRVTMFTTSLEDLVSARELSRYLYLLHKPHEYTEPQVISIESLEKNVTTPTDRNQLSIYVGTLASHRTICGGFVMRMPLVEKDSFGLCGDNNHHYIIGATIRATRYAVYTYLEQYFGVVFDTFGPHLPSPLTVTQNNHNNPLKLPQTFRAVTPAFTTRGLQPFHDFSEGPDWWSEDEYKRVIETIAQMKGNTIAFHTYPINSGLTEPGVWVGLSKDVNNDGTVTKAYSTTWSTTQRNAWGYTPLNTSLYPWGASAMFEYECFGHPIQSGKSNLCPSPQTPADEITLFNEVGNFFKPVFSFAKKLGVQTIMGIETPLTPPSYENGTQQDFYEGVFTRLNALYNDTLTYFWIWTPEGWEWNQVNITDPVVQNVVADVKAIAAAHAKLSPNFKLATCGWVVGPLGARWYFDTVVPSDWFISSIDMNVGNTDVDPAYANITHRTTANKVFIAWSEDDPGLTVPELWLNRTIQHEQQAISYNVGGMMNIHWRTRADSATHGGSHAFAWDTNLTAHQYYLTWCTAVFSPAIGIAAAKVFTEIDSYNLPRPVSWQGGPGGITPDPNNCVVPAAYTWVDSFLNLRVDLETAVKLGSATAAHVENFDYWANQFEFMRFVAQFSCQWFHYNKAIQTIQSVTPRSAQIQAARTTGFAARAELISALSDMMYKLVDSVTGIEGQGTVHNVITHSVVAAYGDAPTSTLTTLANVSSLPSNCYPPSTPKTNSTPHLRVPTTRTLIAQGEDFRFRAWIQNIVDIETVTSVRVHVEGVEDGGGVSWSTTVRLQRVGMQGVVYEGSLSHGALPTGVNMFAYYYEAVITSSTTASYLYYPPTAPGTPATFLLV